MSYYRELLGEFIGTFIMVLFGCGALAAAVLFNVFGSLLEVAMIWGIGVTLAIFTIRNSCPAHLNPAVSLSMALAKKLEWKKLPLYTIFQFAGALCAAGVLFFVFENAIGHFEFANGIVRGVDGSQVTASMFGEFYPNPGFAEKLSINWFGAMSMETLGTFLLVFMIFRITEKKEQNDSLIPVMIGLTVTLIICLVAPFTQAGLNPARDLGPRTWPIFQDGEMQHFRGSQ